MRFFTLLSLAILPLTTQAADTCPKLTGSYVACTPHSGLRLTATQQTKQGVTTYTFLSKEGAHFEQSESFIADGQNRSLQAADDTVLQTNATCRGRILSVAFESLVTPTAKHLTATEQVDYSLLFSARGPILVKKRSATQNPEGVAEYGEQTSVREIAYFAQDAASCDELARILSALKNP